MTVLYLLEQPCNKSDNINKVVVTIRLKLIVVYEWYLLTTRVDNLVQLTQHVDRMLQVVSFLVYVVHIWVRIHLACISRPFLIISPRLKYV